MNKKLYNLFSIILVFILLLTSCGGDPSSKEMNASNEVAAGVSRVADGMCRFVRDKDKAGFMNLMDNSNKEFIIEQSHWFDDLFVNNIEDYSITVDKVQVLGEGNYSANLNIGYTANGKAKNISYRVVFKESGGTYKLHDMEFSELSTKYFIIKYVPALKSQAEKMASFIDDTYDIVRNYYGDVTNEKTAIKLFDDNELINYSVKPSLEFPLGGWFEYGESIKMLIKPGSITNAEKFELNCTRIVSHELTHKTNLLESRNNAPYWILEGIASYVDSGGSVEASPPTKSIMELQKINLEKLNDMNDIRNYYQDSCKFISRFLSKYGMDKLHQIMETMGTYPEKQKTGELIMDENNKTFAEVINKVLGIDIETLNKELMNHIKN